MFKQLLRPNHNYGTTRGAIVNVYLKRGNSGRNVARSFAETFIYVVRQTKMDIDKKMKELTELFSKTGKELSELVKRNEQFIMEEMQKVEDTVRKTTEVCAKGKMDRLRAVKSTYDERIKICNEKTADGLRAAKTICDHRVQEMDSLRSAMKQILKECLETNDFVKCMASETREAVKRRKQISNELNETVKSAEISIADQLKEASKCHVYAQMEALQELQQILKDTQDCIKGELH